jgi:uncharacterized LabA/DUF88 family protein
MNRVSVYIDVFNLYFGMMTGSFRKYLWLDIAALSRAIIASNQKLVSTKYFTAPIRANNDKRKRQNQYLQALDVVGGVDTYLGRYQKKTRSCHTCRATWIEYEEKMTDVRIATELLRDTFKNTYDTAILISADADLVPPVEVVKQDFPGKSIVLWFPPRRECHPLRQIADAHYRIGKGKLSSCQLPENVIKPDGYVLTRPTEWT